MGAVTGLVVAGPTCPVAKYPPDPACADRPVRGAVIVVSLVGGPDVTTVVTGADGRYAVTLPTGAYTLTPQPVDGLMRTAAPVTMVVTTGATVTADFAYDTGIR